MNRENPKHHEKFGIDALVVIGGDGTLSAAYEIHGKGIPLVGIPKTIDNDILAPIWLLVLTPRSL